MTTLSTKLPWSLAQTKWPAQLNPILKLPLLQGNQIDDITMKANIPQAINHGLEQLPQGWFLVDNTANAVVWRSAPLTKTSITLTASANTVISIWVY